MRCPTLDVSSPLRLFLTSVLADTARHTAASLSATGPNPVPPANAAYAAHLSYKKMSSRYAECRKLVAFPVDPGFQHSGVAGLRLG